MDDWQRVGGGGRGGGGRGGRGGGGRGRGRDGQGRGRDSSGRGPWNQAPQAPGAQRGGRAPVASGRGYEQRGAGQAVDHGSQSQRRSGNGDEQASAAGGQQRPGGSTSGEGAVTAGGQQRPGGGTSGEGAVTAGGQQRPGGSTGGVTEAGVRAVTAGGQQRPGGSTGGVTEAGVRAVTAGGQERPGGSTGGVTEAGVRAVTAGGQERPGGSTGGVTAAGVRAVTAGGQQRPGLSTGGVTEAGVRAVTAGGQQRPGGSTGGEAGVQTETTSIAQQAVAEAPPGPSASINVVAAPRPDRGTLGTKTTVRVNHFKMVVKVETIYHYDVSIQPVVTSKAIARALEQQFVLQYRASELNNRLPVYDGSKNLYTAGPLPFEHKEFKVILPERDGRRAREYKLTIKLAATLDQNQLQLFLAGRSASIPQEFIQALDVTLREMPTRSYVPSGRNFFDPSFGKQALEGGHEAWKGFYQSVRLTMQGLVLNIDLSTTAFYEAQGVLEFLKKSIPSFRPDSQRGFSDSERIKARKMLTRLRVEVTHRPSPRRYRISGLSLRPTRTLTFTADDPGTREIRVVDYFWNTYDYRIRYPELPCLELQGNKTTYLPMEVCRLVAGQKYPGKLNENQTTKMLQFTCQSPADRERNITSLMSRVHDFQRNEYVNEFGVRVDSSMTAVDGRILPAPSLRYGNSQIQPKEGDWNLMRAKFLRGGEIRRWTLVNFTRISPPDVEYFINALRTRCREIGVAMSDPVIPPSTGQLEEYDTLLRNAVTNSASRPSGSEGGLQLIVCLMDGKHHLYGDLKKLCETELGVVTQCCLRKNVMKDDRSLSQYLANLAMKINVKVGGQNLCLSLELPRLIPSILGKPTIIFGADVSHPMVRDETSSSISAVVASVDWPSATKYLASARAQSHRVERIEDLGEMTKELFRKFRACTGLVPETMLFFRDGVSEGQFYDVLRNEVTAIRKACKDLKEGYKPKLTFVIVQKRHHTRFFPTNRLHTVKNNVFPGTVVDSAITHPREFDFYLCSHRGLQGTSRPTHYHVLLDENGFSSDQLQMLINNLCYTYARCTKAVSIVPPAYYAHLVAYRARLYADTSGSGSEGASTSAAEFNRSLPPVKDQVRNYMYYC